MLDLLQHAPEEGGLIVSLGTITGIVTSLAGVIVFLFYLYRKSQAEVVAEKEKRLQDAIEYERTLATLKEKLAARRRNNNDSERRDRPED